MQCFEYPVTNPAPGDAAYLGLCVVTLTNGFTRITTLLIPKVSKECNDPNTHCVSAKPYSHLPLRHPGRARSASQRWREDVNRGGGFDVGKGEVRAKVHSYVPSAQGGWGLWVARGSAYQLNKN